MAYDHTRKRVDGNHAAIAQALRDLQWRVFSTAGLDGWFDLIGQRDTHGTVIFEVKADPKAPWTDAQRILIETFGWQVVRLNSIEDVIYFTEGRQPRRQNDTY